MQLSDFLGLLGGLALFLYGMQMMSSGLEAAAGSRMKNILERLTANRLLIEYRFLGVLVGAGITAVIQSSSATTVMVVGFVSAGMMTLSQAVWIIMGANVGTTITGLLIALDVGAMAPVFAFLGVTTLVFIKNPKLQHIGQIMAGLGVLFIGMDMMSASMSPLRQEPAFLNLMASFSNPLLGILAGALFTAVIQSSSASVGILQTLAAGGVLGLDSAVFVLFGQNIGTCITAVLASAGASRDAKRTTLIHLMFNVFGTVLFTLLFLILPLAPLAAQFVPGDPKTQIALVHAAFNITTTLVLLPFGTVLARLAVRFLPDLPEERTGGMCLEFLAPVQASGKDGGLGVSAIYVDQLRKELDRMLRMAQENVAVSFQAVLTQDAGKLEQVEKTEEYIDFLNKEISLYISKIISSETNQQASRIVSSCFAISGNIERIGDHADNICGYTKLLRDKHISFSPAAIKEIGQMQDISLKAIAALLIPGAGDLVWLADVGGMEQRIDDLTMEFRHNQLERMRAGACSEEACIIYAELLTDFERIGDHVLNIAQELALAKS